MSDVTPILDCLGDGDAAAARELLPLVYAELRRLADQNLKTERSDHTLQATALVHEAYLRLVQGENPDQWNSRGHFFGAAAIAMRRILVENARRKGRRRHGGGHQKIPFDPDQHAMIDGAVDIIVVNDLLEQLHAVDPQAASLVNLRYFAGLTMQQAAQVLDISIRTANRDWAYAKAWLLDKMTKTH